MSLRCENCKDARRQCPDCVKAANKIRVRSERHRAISREANRRYRKTEARKITQKLHRQTEKGKETKARWNQERHQTDEYKRLKREYDKRAKEKHPDRYKARAAVNAKVRSGKMPHPSTLLCHDCGQSATQYHHESYEWDRWLDVIPLCGQCHANRHPRTDENSLSERYQNIKGVK